jgi:hypothetical protein
MDCYCCQQEIQVARKVKLRALRHYNPEQGGRDSVAHKSYREEMTFRCALICNECYRQLDNHIGVAVILDRGRFNLASASRGDRAAVVDEAKYRQFQRRQAEQMTLEE